MKLLSFLLIVLAVGVGAQWLPGHHHPGPLPGPRTCRGDRDCMRREECVRGRGQGHRDQLWGGRGRGVCRPRGPRGNRCVSGGECRWDECCDLNGGRRSRRGVCRRAQVPGRRGEICGSSSERRCRSGHECSWNECCVTTNVFIGRKKRQAEARRGSGWEDGVCRPLVRFGERCPTRVGADHRNGIVRSCPCSSAMSCVGGSDIPPHWGSIGPWGTCRAPVTCRRGSDCGPGECCRWGGMFGRQGRCESLAVSGQRCETRPIMRPGRVFSSCPCQRGLRCMTGVVGGTRQGGTCMTPRRG